MRIASVIANPAATAIVHKVAVHALHLLDHVRSEAGVWCANDSLVVIKGLTPSYQCEAAEALRLKFECEVEVLNNGVYSKRDSTGSPEHQHQPRQTICVLPAPVVPYLWNNLHTPTDSANRLRREQDMLA
jgi:hypothetical protein